MRAHVSSWIAAALLLALGLVAPDDTIRTDRPNPKQLPLPSGEDAFQFVIYGDRTGGPAEGIRILEQATVDTNRLAPDLVMTVGDLVQGYNEAPQWLDQMREYHGVMESLTMPWYPVAGNHDIYWRGDGPAPAGEHEQDYEEHFGPLWYWFPHKNSAFFVLYSDEGDPKTGRKAYDNASVNRFSEQQIAWLRQELPKAADREHVFVFLHHPKWMNRYPGSNWDTIHEMLVEAGNVRAVFAGHIHRMHYSGPRDGIEYFALATVGGGIPRELPFSGHYHHFNVVTVRPQGYEIASIPVGDVLDPREYTEERWRESDALVSWSPRLDSDPIDLKLGQVTDGQARYRLTNPSSRPLAIDLKADAEGDWRVTPQRSELVLEPGESRDLTWRANHPSRMPGRELPRVEAAIRLLGGYAPVAFPERHFDLPFRLQLDAAAQKLAFEPASAALHLTPQTQARVESTDASIDDGPLTLEAWMRAEDLRGRRGLITKTENSEYGLFVSDGTPVFSIHLGGRYVSAEGAQGSLTTGRWIHLAGVYDGQEVRLYVDGVRVAKAAGQGRRTTNRLPLYLGADTDGNGRPVSHFEGALDEVRLSTSARYGGERFEPARRIEPDADTRLLYHCDRAVGPFLLDHGPGQRHARLEGPAEIRPLSSD